MKRVILAALTVWVMGGAAQADEQAIQGVISRQIEAFGVDDFERAFGFASPEIQRIFRTPERFGQMVMQGYPMVHRPGEVTYLGLDEAADAFRQVVMIRDAAGKIHMLEYEMTQRADGSWQIDGVRFLPQPEVGA